MTFEMKLNNEKELDRQVSVGLAEGITATMSRVGEGFGLRTHPMPYSF